MGDAVEKLTQEELDRLNDFLSDNPWQAWRKGDQTVRYMSSDNTSDPEPWVQDALEKISPPDKEEDVAEKQTAEDLLAGLSPEQLEEVKQLVLGRTNEDQESTKEAPTSVPRVILPEDA